MAATKKISRHLTKTLTATPPALTPADKAHITSSPPINAAVVIEVFQSKGMGKDANMSVFIDRLRDTFTEVICDGWSTFQKSTRKSLL